MSNPEALQPNFIAQWVESLEKSNQRYVAINNPHIQTHGDNIYLGNEMFGATLNGTRRRNEDFFLGFQNGPYTIMVLTDGMTGSADGQRAASIAGIATGLMAYEYTSIGMDMHEIMLRLPFDAEKALQLMPDEFLADNSATTLGVFIGGWGEGWVLNIGNTTGLHLAEKNPTKAKYITTPQSSPNENGEFTPGISKGRGHWFSYVSLAREKHGLETQTIHTVSYRPNDVLLLHSDGVILHPQNEILHQYIHDPAGLIQSCRGGDNATLIGWKAKITR